jgi:LemA protein
MKILGMALGGVLALLIFVGVIGAMWYMGAYNSLVNSYENVDTAYAAIETQYQRRFDLVPNLAKATQGFLQQEKDVLGEIARARTQYAGAKSGSADQIEAMGSYSSALARLMVVVENYPELKSNQTVRDLMTELAGTENRINVARDRYNESVRAYNVSIKSFPKNMIAKSLGFEERPMFASKNYWICE